MVAFDDVEYTNGGRNMAEGELAKIMVDTGENLELDRERNNYVQFQSVQTVSK